jgi:hypothetical protein
MVDAAWSDVQPPFLPQPAISSASLFCKPWSGQAFVRKKVAPEKKTDLSKSILVKKKKNKKGLYCIPYQAVGCQKIFMRRYLL